MRIFKIARYNEELMKNLPNDLLAELITLEDVIPDNISLFLDKNNHIYNKERSLFLEYHMDIVHKMYAARAKIKELLKTDDSADFYAVLEFIEKYPQFKILVDHVEYNDLHKDLEDSIVKNVPIDEYLAEFKIMF